MRNGTLLICILSIFIAITSFASPSTFTYQGRIIRDDGTPLEYGSVSFAFSIINSSGNCVIYREQRNNINMQGSKGVFDVPIGSGGTKLFPASPTFKLRDAFNNSVIQNCEGGSTYTPLEGDIRVLAVQFHDGTGWKEITPNAEIRSVPFASYADSSARLGDKLPTDFIEKTAISTCAMGQYLTFDGTNFTCQNDAGGAGMVSDVNVTAPLTKGGTASIPVIGVSVGIAAGTVAAGNDSRFGNALKIQSVNVDPTAPTLNQVLKFDGSSWIASALAISDVANLQTQLNNKLNTTMFPASCTAGQSLVFQSPSNTFVCYDIVITESQISGSISGAKISGNISGNAAGFTGSLNGDVTGTQSSTVVGKIHGIPVDTTAPATGEVLKYDGSKWAPAADSTNAGTVTNVSGTAGQIGVATGATTPVISLIDAGTAGTYFKVTTDAKGRVTSGVASLVTADIPGLDWSKITSGRPTTLSGYGITDSLVLNAGGTPGIQTGLDASKPASPSAGSIYFATDSKTIYQYNSGAWVSIASASGSGGTVTNVSGTAGQVSVATGATTPVISLANSGVTAGSYTRANITVDAFGRITTATNGANVSLTSEVAGTLPIANGGTGATNALNAFNTLSPISTKGALISNDGTNNISLTVGANGQVLSADSTQSSGLKWVTSTNGTVTNVTGTLPIVVATGTSTPAISVNAATSSTLGVVQAGAGISVTSGTISADPTNFPSVVPVSKGGTGASSMTGNRLVASNGTGSAYAPFNCLVGQTISFDASGVPSCTSYTSAGFFLNGGNSFGASATLGTNDSNALGFKTNNAVAMTIETTGNVGIGTTTPSDLLTLSSADSSNGVSIINTSSTSSRSPGFNVYNYSGSASGNASLLLQSARGTYAAATSLKSYDKLGQILFQGLKNGSTYVPGAQIYAQTSEDWAAGTAGTQLIINTTSTSNTSPSERMRIAETGNVGIGSSDPKNLLQVGPQGNNATQYGIYAGSYSGSTGYAPYTGNWASSGYWGIGPNSGANDSTLRIGNTSDQIGTWSSSQTLKLLIGGNITTQTQDTDAIVWAKSVSSIANTTGGTFIGTRARGTFAAPTHPQTDDLIAQFLGKNGIAGVTSPGLVIWSSENQSSTAQGDYLTLRTTPNGTTTTAERMRITNNGLVGIGTSSPTSLLTLKATSGSKLFNIISSGLPADQRASMMVGGWEFGTDVAIDGTKNLFFWDSNTNNTRMMIDPNGWVAFNKGGTAAAGAPLYLYNPTAPYIGYEEGDTGQKFFEGVDAATFWIRPGPTTSSANALTINANGLVAINGMPNVSYNFTVNGTAVGNSAWTNVSDGRLKKNIEVIPDSLNKILQLRGVTFDWRHDVRPNQNYSQRRDMGVIAQEVEQVFPEAVDTDSEGFKAVGYTKLIGPLIESTKELAGLCKMNESQLAKLQSVVAEQSREIASLKQENTELREAICEINPKSKICKKK